METAILASLPEEEAKVPNFVTKNLEIGGIYTVNPSLSSLFIGTSYVRTIICLQLQFLIDGLRHIFDLAGSQKSFRVGILGCGRVGSSAVHHLLASSGLSPSAFYVGTRQPENKRCVELSDKGVNISNDNKTATNRVRVLLIACLPSQMMDVARSVAGTIRKSTLVCSIVPGYTTQKLAKMLQLDDENMVLRIGCQIPISIVSSSLGEESNNNTTQICTFAGQVMLNTHVEVERLHNAFVKCCNTVLPTPMTDSKGRAIISDRFSNKALVCQALYGSHQDPGENTDGGIDSSPNDARKACVIQRFPTVCVGGAAKVREDHTDGSKGKVENWSVDETSTGVL
tara:strand:- start:1670 stop:2692 length:1023 start_codon:yes stop_codon:yes gene_type:complete